MRKYLCLVGDSAAIGKFWFQDIYFDKFGLLIEKSTWVYSVRRKIPCRDIAKFLRQFHWVRRPTNIWGRNSIYLMAPARWRYIPHVDKINSRINKNRYGRELYYIRAPNIIGHREVW